MDQCSEVVIQMLLVVIPSVQWPLPLLLLVIPSPGLSRDPHTQQLCRNKQTWWKHRVKYLETGKWWNWRMSWTSEVVHLKLLLVLPIPGLWEDRPTQPVERSRDIERNLRVSYRLKHKSENKDVENKWNNYINIVVDQLWLKSSSTAFSLYAWADREVETKWLIYIQIKRGVKCEGMRKR